MAASDSSSSILRSRVRRQEALAELGQRALESTDLDGMLADGAAAATDALAVDACSVLELRSHGDAAVLRAGDGWDGDAVGSVTVPTDPDSWAGTAILQQMIDGLLQYSRVDTQGDSFCPVDCEAVIDDVLADLEVRIDETDAEITTESLPQVYGDPGQLRQLFQNLLDNAITYSSNGTPRISVFADNTGETWQISVRDRGIGIDSSDTDRIFQVFDRLHSHEEYDGTGIGLALCRRIAERHGGEIGVDSQPGEGSTFTIALPTVPDADEALERAPAREADTETDSAMESVTDE